MKPNQNSNDSAPPHVLTSMGNPKIKDYIDASLKSSYGQYTISSNVVSYIIDMLCNNMSAIIDVNKRHTLVESIRHHINQQANYQQIYEHYKQMNKSAIHYQMISAALDYAEEKNGSKNLHIGDIGCGNNALAQFIITQRPAATAIGTDLLPYQTEQSSRVTFIQQKIPTVIPLDSSRCDVICLMSVLHHIDTQHLPDFMMEIRRILKPNGTILVLEDSYSETTPPLYQNGLLWKKFIAIEPSQRKKAISIIDWIGCVLASGDINMNLPYCFNTIDEWKNIFTQLNLTLVQNNFLGFIAKRFHFSPQTFFMLE